MHNITTTQACHNDILQQNIQTFLQNYMFHLSNPKICFIYLSNSKI